MIYTLTLNPSIDYYVTLPEVNLGEVNRIEETTERAGGKGINVSIVLREYEKETKALGFIGGTTGDFIKKSLVDHGVHTDFVEVNGNTRINVKIRAKEETELNASGPNITDGELEHLQDKFDQVDEGDIVVLAGSIPSNLPDSLYRTIAESIREKGADFVVDTTKDAMLEVLSLEPLMIKPNHHELGELFDTEIETFEDALPYAEQLVERGAKNVIISFAGDGALLVNKNGAVTANTPVGKLVNSVGAGDSLVAGFVANVKEKGEQEAFRYAVTTGSASAYTFGLCSKQDIDRLIDQVQLTPLKRMEETT
ncbi:MULTISPECIES: 1-phosphofructokinase [unclassified Exiguobacterium]|uniref:1-phosphofructokinase n=1 Tax=unclassified Exiguobacterium TaxID=2644629 RepID=UPI001BE59606|nr:MULTISPECIES: 1-phosphofructokinase [unclassified Exiguobacterium]